MTALRRWMLLWWWTMWKKSRPKTKPESPPGIAVTRLGANAKGAAFQAQKESGPAFRAQLPIGEGLSRARPWLAKGEDFQFLALYVQQVQPIHRAIEKNMAGLRILRTARQAAPPQALEEAQLPAQLAFSKGGKYHPASGFPPDMPPIGSDFSSAGISRLTVGRPLGPPASRLRNPRFDVRNQRFDERQRHKARHVMPLSAECHDTFTPSR
jgi:hypothetical protein